MSLLFLLFSARCPPAHSPTVNLGTTVCKVYKKAQMVIMSIFALGLDLG